MPGQAPIGPYVPVSDNASKQLQRLRIQAAIVDLCKGGKFFAVVYDKETGKPVQIDPSTAAFAPPASCVTNEVASNFEIDNSQGRRLIRRRSGWRFEAICVWDREVTLETFEESLSSSPPTLPADPINRLGQARLHLLSSTPVHPIQQQPSSGTRCTFLFEIETSRP